MPSDSNFYPIFSPAQFCGTVFGPHWLKTEQICCCLKITGTSQTNAARTTTLGGRESDKITYYSKKMGGKVSKMRDLQVLVSIQVIKKLIRNLKFLLAVIKK